MITPYCDTDGLFFSGENEPEEFIHDFRKTIFDHRKKIENGKFVEIEQGLRNEIIEYNNKLRDKSSIKKIENKTNKRYIKYFKNYDTEE